MMVIVTTAGAAPPPLTAATSADGLVTATVDATWAGVLVEVDYRALMPGAYAVPFRADVYRTSSSGTVLVRSGNPVVGYGGRAWAYDHEAPLGEAVLYTAVPRMADGTPGPASGGAQVVTSAPAGGFDDPGVWIKSLTHPELSVRVRVDDWSSGSYAGRSTTADLLGSRYPTATVRRRQAHTTRASFTTTGDTESAALLAVLDEGVVLVQGLRRFHRDDGYYLPGDVDWKRLASAGHGWRSWTVALVEVARPGTADQPLVVPGRSLARRAEIYPTFADVAFSGRVFAAGLAP